MKKSISFVALLWAGLLCGCNGSGSSSASVGAPNAPKPVNTPTATPSATNATKLKSGASPLTYLVGGGGPIRIVDTTSATTVVTQIVAPQAVIIIDDAKGISISGSTVVKGPLPTGHQYEIWLDQK